MAVKGAYSNIPTSTPKQLQQENTTLSRQLTTNVHTKETTKHALIETKRARITSG